jgi:major membrane immunogen (membrane-anchored lipoprotein)
VATAQQALPGTPIAASSDALIETQNTNMISNAAYAAASANQLNGSALQLLQRSLPGLIVVMTLFALLLFYNWLDTGNYRPFVSELARIREK